MSFGPSRRRDGGGRGAGPDPTGCRLPLDDRGSSGVKWGGVALRRPAIAESPSEWGSGGPNSLGRIAPSGATGHLRLRARQLTSQASEGTFHVGPHSQARDRRPRVAGPRGAGVCPSNREEDRSTMLATGERPRELRWYHAGPMLFGDWGTSRLYVLGLAFAFTGRASFWFIAAMCVLMIGVGWSYEIICRLFPDGGGVYSSARHRSQLLAVDRRPAALRRLRGDGLAVVPRRLPLPGAVTGIHGLGGAWGSRSTPWRRR